MSVNDLRLGKPRSSTQAGYRITFSIEVNDVEKVVIWFGDVGHQIEEGTLIGITRRNFVKNKIIQFYYCVFHYERWLKTERYENKQVVLKFSLIILYQKNNLEVILKYWGRDTSQSSLVFRCSKNDESERRTTALIHPQHKKL